MNRWAPDNEDGLHAYVVISQSMWDLARGTDYRTIVYAPSLRDAKSEHGWTRATYTTITVRRATPSDIETVEA